MSNDNHTAAPVDPKPVKEVAPAVLIRRPMISENAAGDFIHQLPAWIISVVGHTVMIALFLLIGFGSSRADAPREATVIQTNVEEEKEYNLQNEDEGLDPSKMLAYNLERIENVSVPGPEDLTQPVGIKGGDPEAAVTSIPPPPGFGAGQGGANDLTKIGSGSQIGSVGGYGGPFVPGGFAGRSGATRVKMAIEGGGNTASEAAVARGLTWIASHQAPDGHWALDSFNQHGNCKCNGFGQRNDIAGTAFGLLPLLGAGEHHRNAKARYGKHCEKGLKYLIEKQKDDGNFGGGMYAHGLATIAMCEAYAMTSDPKLKQPAQKAINYIRAAQHDAGGWRYQPRQPGDTSVVGWQVMALKSGQMAGLEVDDARNPTFAKAMKFLDSVMESDGGGYGYTGKGRTPTMTAVGLLCRQYMGWGPRNANLLAGVQTLKQTPPGKLNSMYYYYYATQVLHHLGGEDWKAWNEKMRDTVMARQDKGNSHSRGSWDPKGDAHASQGGRLMHTSLSLLTLEVYYRHLPLYRRDLLGKNDK
jgi:hypothetical protein